MRIKHPNRIDVRLVVRRETRLPEQRRWRAAAAARGLLPLATVRGEGEGEGASATVAAKRAAAAAVQSLMAACRRTEGA